MHIYKAEEWQLESGYWVCNDTSDLGNGSGYWWHPARMLNISPANYVKLVIDKFNPDEVWHSDDCSIVGFRWKSQSKMRIYKNWLNSEARKHQYYI